MRRWPWNAQPKGLEGRLTLARSSGVVFLIRFRRREDEKHADDPNGTLCQSSIRDWHSAGARDEVRGQQSVR